MNPRDQTLTARIFQRGKTAMQSGRARVGQWTLEFVPTEAQRADPLMGWAGSGETRRQIRLTFPDLEAAQAYADRQGIAYRVEQNPERTLKLQAYADNFR